MNLFIGVLSFLVIISHVNSDSADEEAQACMIQKLKQKELLNEDFPYPRQPTRCFLVATIINTMEDGFYTKLDNQEGINADCVKNELKEKNLIYYVIKKEVIERSKNIPNEEVKNILNVNKEAMKGILNNIAKDCNSDDKWAGIFDDVLDIKNTSHAALESNYCLLKTSIDKNLINIENINVNPFNIDTSNVDCNAIVENRNADIVNQLTSKYNELGLPKNKVDCIIMNLKSSNFFDTTIALETLEKLDIEPSVRARSKEKLSSSIQAGIRGIFTCVI